MPPIPVRCSAEGCSNFAFVRGWCHKHYNAWRRNGGQVRTHHIADPVGYFWSKVDKNGPVHPDCGQCWVWTGPTRGGRYGEIKKLGIIYAHRFSWYVHFGEAPADLLVCHRCDNVLCVNPEHLFVGTILDNINDKIKKGRQPRGEQSCHKLTEAEVRFIFANHKKRKFRGWSSKLLAKKFKVSTATILRIIKGENWSHITGLNQK